MGRDLEGLLVGRDRVGAREGANVVGGVGELLGELDGRELDGTFDGLELDGALDGFDEVGE